jgi:selenide, water dikinase
VEEAYSHNLVLIGGGHSHAILLKLLAMQPPVGVRTILVSDATDTPYSGMLPAHVAGFYSYEETHIDLRRLARSAGAEFYKTQAISLDLNNNRVICVDRPSIHFNYLSIDIGSTPNIDSVAGAAKYAIKAKPVPEFLAAWARIVALAKANPHQKLRLAIVGGGAGGVELALNMQQRLQNFTNPEIHLIHQNNYLLSDRHNWAGDRLKNLLQKRQIRLHLSERVTEVFPDRLICDSGSIVNYNYLFWVTNASAPSWLKESGLTTDDRGFILVNNYLQSLSHSHVFAAGDIATMANFSRPKAGVFAVRQGKPLFKNILRSIEGKSLQEYIPQKRYLALIGTADKSAVATWGYLGWQSSLFWYWKDWIDRQFMNEFARLPTMQSPTKSVRASPDKNQQSIMYCNGCAAKISSKVLHRVLSRLPSQKHSDIIIGLDNSDDCSVVQIPQNRLLVQTIDRFPAFINDPFIFGKIATNHCLSDLFAKGAIPHSVLATATIPYAGTEIAEEILFQLLSGSIEVLAKIDVPILGGHTEIGDKLAFGLSCNGTIERDRVMTKNNLKPEQLLILTKPIGTGTILAAEMRGLVRGSRIDETIDSMLISNQKAAEIFLDFEVEACTDITGFGLVGHLLEMLKGNNLNVELFLESIPVLGGAIDTIRQGIYSSLHPANFQNSRYLLDRETIINTYKYQLLFDPQTSGGLLGAVAVDRSEECLSLLKANGYQNASIIGKIEISDFLAIDNDKSIFIYN